MRRLLPLVLVAAGCVDLSQLSELYDGSVPIVDLAGMNVPLDFAGADLAGLPPPPTGWMRSPPLPLAFPITPDTGSAPGVAATGDERFLVAIAGSVGNTYAIGVFDPSMSPSFSLVGSDTCTTTCVAPRVAASSTAWLLSLRDGGHTAYDFGWNAQTRGALAPGITNCGSATTIQGNDVIADQTDYVAAYGCGGGFKLGASVTGATSSTEVRLAHGDSMPEQAVIVYQTLTGTQLARFTLSDPTTITAGKVLQPSLLLALGVAIAPAGTLGVLTGADGNGFIDVWSFVPASAATTHRLPASQPTTASSGTAPIGVAAAKSTFLIVYERQAGGVYAAPTDAMGAAQGEVLVDADGHRPSVAADPNAGMGGMYAITYVTSSGVALVTYTPPH